MSQWKGKVAAITGAASGIGRSLAVSFAGRGCRLALSDVNEAGLEETKALVEAKGAEVTTTLVDVSKREEVEAWAEKTATHFGGVDIVINNAGVTVVDTVERMSYEDFEWLMGINFWGVVYGSKSFLPYLRKSSGGYLVNISSVFGIISVPTQSSYNASKFAVRGFTESLRQELRDTSILVSCVHPGGIKTSIARNARHYHRPGMTVEKEKTVKRFEGKMTPTTPDEAAEVIITGMERRKKRILIGKDARLIAWLQWLFPVGYDSFVARMQKP